MKKFLIILVVVLALAQFIQPPHNNGSAEAATDITHVLAVPDSVLMVLKKSCYDCHSNHTNYPWYSKITPVNWWLNSHINDGKFGLNFSEFAGYTYKKKAHRMNDIAETVEKHEMPLNSYLWIHKDAALSEAQQQLLIRWGKAASQQILQDSIRASAH